MMGTETMVENVLHDKKDALPSAVRSLKKLMIALAISGGDADPDVVLCTIRDPTAVYL